jgi:hypothetical protein
VVATHRFVRPRGCDEIGNDGGRDGFEDGRARASSRAATRGCHRARRGHVDCRSPRRDAPSQPWRQRGLRPATGPRVPHPTRKPGSTRAARAGSREAARAHRLGARTRRVRRALAERRRAHHQLLQGDPRQARPRRRDLPLLTPGPHSHLDARLRLRRGRRSAPRLGGTRAQFQPTPFPRDAFCIRKAARPHLTRASDAVGSICPRRRS